MSKEQLSITLSRELLEELDEARGSIPRSTYIEELLRRQLDV